MTFHFYFLRTIIFLIAVTLLFSGTVLAREKTTENRSLSQSDVSLVKTFHHGGNANNAAWSPAGDLLMTWMKDPNLVGLNSVQIWDIASGATIQTLEHGIGIASAAWGPDQSHILTTTYDNIIHVWAIDTGQQTQTMSHDDRIWGVSWDKDGEQILSWSDDATARLWDAETGQELYQWEHESAVGGASFNPDESRVLTWSGGGAVVVWERDSGEEVLRYKHDGLVYSAMWSPDGDRVMSIGNDLSVRVVDSSSGDEIYNLGIPGTEAGARWNQDGRLILGYADWNYVIVWDAMTGELVFDINVPRAISIHDAFWTPSETQIGVITFETVWVYDAKFGAWDYDFSHASDVRTAAWSGNGAFVLTQTIDGKAHLWETLRGELIADLTHPDRNINFIAWHPDDVQFVTVSRDGTINIWQAPL
ncbi:MAG: WD40 repeat domain-containing protein [Chloroflexi bacterium]|nr:WD40 repeat domain-containing protein [Chloroflexota bacterium]